MTKVTGLYNLWFRSWISVIISCIYVLGLLLAKQDQTNIVFTVNGALMTITKWCSKICQLFLAQILEHRKIVSFVDTPRSALLKQ